MSGWKEYKLGQIVETLDNQRIPLSSMERAQRKGIYRYYGAQGVIDYIDSYIFDGKYMLVAEDGNNIKERKENIALIAEGKYWVNNHAHILKSNGKCDLDLVCYIINQMDISGFVTGTAQPKLNQANLMKLPLYLPDLPTQQRIASILSSLDAKIENNNKINAKLEEIAQNLFKEWFVDFGPFKNGKFVESELGLIPEGWRVKKIGELDLYITDYVSNGSFATLKENVQLYENDNYAYFIRNTDLKNGTFQVYVDEHSYNFLSKSKLEGGEIIISNVGDVGSVHICPTLDKPMTLGNNIIMVKSDDFNLHNYIYHYFNSRIGQHNIHAITSGSAIPKFNKTEFKGISVLLPPKTILEKFGNITINLIKSIEQHKKEIVSLEQIRDTLLPKLMSGEIEV